MGRNRARNRSALLEASEAVRFQGKRRQEVYEWITRLLRQQGYRTQGKVVRGLLRSYVAKMTGRSRAQVTPPDRALSGAQRSEGIQPAAPPLFQSRFTRADVELLAKVDEAHER